MYAPALLDNIAFTAWIIACECVIAIPIYYAIRAVRRGVNNPGSKRVIAPAPAGFKWIEWGDPADNGMRVYVSAHGADVTLRDAPTRVSAE